MDVPQGAVPLEKGLVTGEEASGKGLEDGSLGDLQVLTPALEEVAGCRASNPEEELDGDSFHPDGLVTGHGGSDGGDDEDVRWAGDDGGDCCCCCNGDGCCYEHGGDGESDGLYDHADVSLEG